MRWQAVMILVCAMAGLLLAEGGAQSQPAVPTSEPASASPDQLLDERLDNTIIDAVSFDAVALDDALAWITHTGRISLRVKLDAQEGREIPVAANTKVHCEGMRHVSLRKVLESVLESVSPPHFRIGWASEQGRLVIGPEAALRDRRYMVTRKYDVRDLLVKMSGEMGGGQGAAVMKQRGDPGVGEPYVAEIKELMNLIWSTVDAHSCCESTEASIRMMGTTMLISQTLPKQREVADLLRLLGEPEWPAMREKLSRKAEKIEIKEVSLADAVKLLRQQTGLNFVIDPGVSAARTPLTLEVQGLTCEQVLNHLCRMARVRWALADGAVCIYP